MRIDTLVGAHDLSYSQFALLNHLVGRGEPSSISELAAAMEINQPGVTKVVKRLGKLGLVSADVDPEDSRRRLISATPAAGERLEEISHTLEADSEGWFAGWSDAGLVEFRDRLADLTGWLDANRLT